MGLFLLTEEGIVLELLSFRKKRAQLKFLAKGIFLLIVKLTWKVKGLID